MTTESETPLPALIETCCHCHQDTRSTREQVLRSAYDRLVLQNDRIDNRCTQLKKELHEKMSDLEESQSEIARHHELIAWMREEIEWAINDDIDPVEGQERREHIRSRLNREVS